MKLTLDRRLAGATLLLLGAVCNQWVLSRAFSSDGVLELETRAKIWLLQGISILIGSVLIAYEKASASTRFSRRLLLSHPTTLALSLGLFLAAFILFLTELCFYGLNVHKQPGRAVYKQQVLKGTGMLIEPLLGFRMPANAQISATMLFDEQVIYDVIYSTDEHRRRIVPDQDRAGRIDFMMFFGCSYTFGEGVNDNQTLPYYAAQAAPRYRAYNYGMMGYGPQGMLAKLQSGELRSELTEKRGILVYTFIDDHFYRAVGSMQVHNTWGKNMPFYTIDHNDNLVRKGSFTSGRPVTAALFWLLGKSETLKYFGVNFPSKINDAHIGLTARIFEESYRVFREQWHSDDFYVVLFPGTKHALKMIPYFTKAGIKYLDYSKLIDRNKEEFHIKEDPHPTPRAYMLVAQTLAKDLGHK